VLRGLELQVRICFEVLNMHQVDIIAWPKMPIPSAASAILFRTIVSGLEDPPGRSSITKVPLVEMIKSWEVAA
jgi:hypothetical protein